jgi:hypothetical protein
MTPLLATRWASSLPLAFITNILPRPYLVDVMFYSPTAVVRHARGAGQSHHLRLEVYMAYNPYMGR